VDKRGWQTKLCDLSLLVNILPYLSCLETSIAHIIKRYTNACLHYIIPCCCAAAL